MKIIFDSEAEKGKMICDLVENYVCPSDFCLKNSCARGKADCDVCWRAALEAVEKRRDDL